MTHEVRAVRGTASAAQHAHESGPTEDRTYLCVGVANVIEEMRLIAKLTQDELASLTKMSPTIVRGLEEADDAEVPNLMTVARIARACGFELLLVAAHRRGRKRVQSVAARLSASAR